MASKKLSIIIPCYNEQSSINKLIDNCIETINEEVEILLVDNGSSDNTYKTLLNLNLPKNIVIYRIEKNIGYGNGILFGLKKAKGEILSWTHADLQTDISDVIRGFNIYEKELNKKTCIVKGERKNRNIIDSFFTFSMGVYSSVLLGKWLYDINAQPKIFHKSFLKKFKNPPLDFSLDLYILYFFISKQIEIKTFPVFFKKRLFGKAKGGGTFKGKLRLIKRTLHYIHFLKKTL
ncbi:MAG: glycosyltransferase family 2 protein [Flavobacteriaceae bacterium]|jgi:glycosyltransferase involved in cell wall biosynthesis|nr:glycosyltransferase family 2 protein [Flavobacteriaceae bacterium]MBT6448350.1 glycosyltransferase family 2 protein [Flavobacteriaceae bacterium]